MDGLIVTGAVTVMGALTVKGDPTEWDELNVSAEQTVQVAQTDCGHLTGTAAAGQSGPGKAALSGQCGDVPAQGR